MDCSDAFQYLSKKMPDYAERRANNGTRPDALLPRLSAESDKDMQWTIQR
jgi:hypothetical protein